MQFFAENFWLSFGATTKLLSQSFFGRDFKLQKWLSSYEKMQRNYLEKIESPMGLTFYNVASEASYC